jgi:TPP-dependent pyruvate/acetoin dehydrogenase alpha subunit
VAELDKKVREVVEDAVAFSERSEEPDPMDVYSDVYTS